MISLHRLIGDSTHKREAAIVCLAIVVAAGVRLLLLDAGHFPTDSNRFLSQAESIRSLNGFGLDGQLQTHLPPGYPVFIATLTQFSDSLDLLRGIQVLLSVASCLFVYLAVRPRSLRLALLSLFALAVSPWVGRFAGYILSETLGLFIVSLLIFALSRFEESKDSLVSCFAVGFLCLAAILTSPGTIFLCFGVWCVAAWKCLRRVPQFFSLVAGALLLFIPWQVHCYAALGRLELRMFTAHSNFSRGFIRWIAMTTLREGDLSTLDLCLRRRPQPEKVDGLSARYFTCGEERGQVKSITEQLVEGRISKGEWHEAYDLLADRKRAESPLFSTVVAPLSRSAFLWLDMRRVGQAKPYLVGGSVAALKSKFTNTQKNDWRPIREAIISDGAFVLHLGYLSLFVGCAVVGLMSREPFPLAILFGLVMYTIVGSFFGLQEARRNLVFYPAILVLLYFTPRRVLPAI